MSDSWKVTVLTDKTPTLGLYRSWCTSCAWAVGVSTLAESVNLAYWHGRDWHPSEVRL